MITQCRTHILRESEIRIWPNLNFIYTIWAKGKSEYAEGQQYSVFDCLNGLNGNCLCFINFIQIDMRILTDQLPNTKCLFCLGRMAVHLDTIRLAPDYKHLLLNLLKYELQITATCCA